MSFLIFLGIIAIVGFWLVGAYNGLVALRNKVQEAWSGIDVQLKRRYDLIPNLVNTVKGYASHEAATLEKVIQARNQAISVKTGDVQGQAEAETMLSGALRQFFALSESYPDLKANTNFIELQRSLTQIEDQIQSARRYYNALVRDNNTKVESFPTNLIANNFGFVKYEYFEITDDSQRDNVKVQF
jgi:LemA protein